MKFSAQEFSETPFRKTALALGMLFATFGAGVATADTFENTDANSDDMITSDEYHRSADEMGVFSDWDMNDDGLLGENEWNDDFDYDYDNWDEDNDGYLDSNEFYTGTYEYYDEDEDGHWDGDDWDDAGDDGLFDV